MLYLLIVPVAAGAWIWWAAHSPPMRTRLIEAGHRLAPGLMAALVGRVRDYVRRAGVEWVAIELPDELDVTARLLEAKRREVAAAEAWAPPDVVVDPTPFSRFEPFDLPDVVASSMRLRVAELDKLRKLTHPRPAATLAALGSRHCGYPGPFRKVPEAFDAWPRAVAGLPTHVPPVRFELLTDSELKADLVHWAFQEEMVAVAAARTQVNALHAQINELNAKIAALNARAVAARNAYEQEYRAVVAATHEANAAAVRDYEDSCSAECRQFSDLLAAYAGGDRWGTIRYVRTALRLVTLPPWLSTRFDVGFDESGRVLVVDVELPNLADLVLEKPVLTPERTVAIRPPSKQEAAEVLELIHPLALLRVACEVARLDTDGLLEQIAVNGWTEYRSRSTWRVRTAYVASLAGDPKRIGRLTLRGLDAVAAFRDFQGQSTGITDEVVPLTPTFLIDRNDPRAEVGREPHEGDAGWASLAMIDARGFEQLIRELLQKLFKGAEVEVGVVPADGGWGIEGWVLDPDPIRGGTTVILARRCATNIDLGAVRALFDAVQEKGAVRGILLATSDFEPEAQQFAEGKPLTLIDGSHLLAYLKDAGATPRRDMDDAGRGP